jgi:hypothetical protein
VHRTNAEFSHVPLSTWQTKPPNYEAYRCSHCGLVWFQGLSKFGEAIRVGWWDNFSNPDEFVPYHGPNPEQDPPTVNLKHRKILARNPRFFKQLPNK